MNFLSFRELYRENLLVEVIIDGATYKLGALTFPNNTKIILGISPIPYKHNYVFQIIKTINDVNDRLKDNEKLVGELKQLNADCDKTFLIFKYSPEKPGHDFIIIREPNEEALSQKEIDWLWNLL